MNVLIVSFFDDNFGDMLIRICFERLLRAALKNLGVLDYTIDRMPLKRIDKDKIAASDIIFFAGGGIFGLSYLNFFDYIDAITEMAEGHHIPVIFSSLGINNMNATEENEHRLTEVLKRSCIKAMSVRDNLELFQYYAKGCDYEVIPVCDPAVWTKYVYSREIQRIRAGKNGDGRKIVGVNVVRGGLFKDNGKAWTLGTEEKYLCELKKLLEAEGIAVRFFTNGLSLDDNALGCFAQKYEIPDEQCIYPCSTREAVETIAGFDAVIAIRMHASVISYALDIPSIDLAWNDKIPFFYNDIGYPDRAIALEECTPELVLEKTRMLLADTGYAADQNYMMSLYRYLYNVLSEQRHIDSGAPYSFEEVTKELASYDAAVEDDVIDYRTKIERGEQRYLSLFIKNRAANEKIRAVKEEIRSTRQQLEEKRREAEKMQRRLDRIDSYLIVRIYKKLHKAVKPILRAGRKISFCMNVVIRNLRYRRGFVQNNKVFVTTFDNDFSCNPRYIVTEILKQQLPVDIVWVVSNKGQIPEEHFPDTVRLVQLGSRAMYEEMASSKVWIDNALNCVWNYMPKKKSQLYLNTWHGSMGIKKLNGSRGWLRRAKRCNKTTDFCISNSIFEESVYHNTFWKDVPCLKYGHARNDIFFDENQTKNMREKICKYLGIDQKKKMFLYAPTFRDNNRMDWFDLDFGRVKKSLERRFGGDWIILIRMHFKNRNRTADVEYNEWKRNVSGYGDMQELLAAVDAGMTDYSSWAYDYMLTRRPMFLYVPDLEEYDQDRGFYYPVESTPFPIAHNIEEVEIAIDSFDDENYRLRIDQFLQEKGCYEDGHASERIVKFIMEAVGQ